MIQCGNGVEASGRVSLASRGVARVAQAPNRHLLSYRQEDAWKTGRSRLQRDVSGDAGHPHQRSRTHSPLVVRRARQFCTSLLKRQTGGLSDDDQRNVRFEISECRARDLETRLNAQQEGVGDPPMLPEFFHATVAAFLARADEKAVPTLRAHVS